MANFSDVMYCTFLSGAFTRKWFPIAWIRCVLPRPVGPYTNNGLYAMPGLRITAWAAAYANSLNWPTIKVEKVKRGFRFVFAWTVSSGNSVDGAGGRISSGVFLGLREMTYSMF